jgi:hypothetical protein
VPVRAQAEAILERLGPSESDLRTVLEREPPDGRALIVREELLRSVDAGDVELAADMRAWIAVHVGSALEPVEVAELWLGGLLEVTPDALERIARSAVTVARGSSEQDQETFRSAVSRAMARFHVPQWMRLQDVFSRAAADAGDPRPWR